MALAAKHVYNGMMEVQPNIGMLVQADRVSKICSKSFEGVSDTTHIMDCIYVKLLEATAKLLNRNFHLKMRETLRTVLVDDKKENTANYRWAYNDASNQDVTSLTITQLLDAEKTGKLGHTRLVWRQGWGEWKNFDDVPELAQPAKDNFGYYEGPIKTPARMEDKLGEYVQEGKPFPRAENIIDPIRASIALKKPQDVMEAFKLLDRQDGFRLVRYKNKFSTEEKRTRCDRNLMVNILFEVNGERIIGELQLTTLSFLKIKKVDHKLYSLTRVFRGNKSPQEIHTSILRDVCKVSV